MSQHSSLSPERWSAFGLEQQILMIGNEMNRASQLMRPDDLAHRQRSYERVLRLVDLTVEVQQSRSLRREILRWRDLIAALYTRTAPAGSLPRRLAGASLARSSRGGVLGDLLDFVPQLPLGVPQIVGRLHAKPEAGTVPTKPAKAHRHLRRDGRALGKDRMQHLTGDAKLPRRLGNGKIESREHVLA
jgi:hypothetical protein